MYKITLSNMHRSGSGVFSARQMDLPGCRSVTEHSLRGRDRVDKQISAMMKWLDTDKSVPKAAAKRIAMVLYNRMIKTYYEFMLKLTRREKEDLSKSMNIGKRQLMMRSRLSSYTVGEQDNLTKTFSLFSIDNNTRGTRQLIGLINKKIVFAKLHPFHKLKKNLLKCRENIEKTNQGGLMIKEVMKKQLKRLKKQMFFKLIATAYSNVRTTKCDLVKIMKKNSKSTGQHLIRVLKKLIRSKMSENIWYIKDYGNTSRTFSKVENLIWKIWQRDSLKMKKQGITKLKTNVLRSWHFNKIVNLSNILFRKLQTKQLTSAIDQLKGNVRDHHKIASATRNLKNIFNKTLTKNLSDSLSKLKTHKIVSDFVASYSSKARTAAQQNSILNELETSQLNKLKESLELTERLLRKEQLQNRGLTEKLIFNQKVLNENNRELRHIRVEMNRLQRQLKQKDTLVKKLLIEQNKTADFMNKQREEIYSLRSGKNFNCECVQNKHKEFAELSQVGQQLNALLEKYIETEEDMADGLSFVRQQYEITTAVLEQSQKVAGSLCLNPLLKNDYPVLSHIRNSFAQILEYIRAAYGNYLTTSTVEAYLQRVRTMPQERVFDALQLTRVTNEILDSLKPSPENNNYRLIKGKILQFSRNSETFNREFRKLVDKATSLRNLMGKLDSNQRDVRVYLYEFKDLGMIVNKINITGWHSPSDQAETEPHPSFQILKPLFMDLMDEGTSYHKKKTLRDKIAKCLGFSAEERSVFEGS